MTDRQWFVLLVVFAFPIAFAASVYGPKLAGGGG